MELEGVVQNGVIVPDDATALPEGTRVCISPAPPGLAQATSRAAAAVGPQRHLGDVIREIAAGQRSRGFPGRSAEELRAEDDARQAEDAERDRELGAARRGASPGGP